MSSRPRRPGYSAYETSPTQCACARTASHDHRRPRGVLSDSIKKQPRFAFQLGPAFRVRVGLMFFGCFLGFFRSFLSFFALFSGAF